jgi:hypothetical protein
MVGRLAVRPVRSSLVAEAPDVIRGVRDERSFPETILQGVLR